MNAHLLWSAAKFGIYLRYIMLVNGSVVYSRFMFILDVTFYLVPAKLFSELKLLQEMYHSSLKTASKLLSLSYLTHVICSFVLLK